MKLVPPSYTPITTKDYIPAAPISYVSGQTLIGYVTLFTYENGSWTALIQRSDGISRYTNTPPSSAGVCLWEIG